MDAIPPQMNESAPPPSGASGGCGCGTSGGGGGNAVAVVGVRLHGQVRVSQFNSGEIDFEVGDPIVVEGEQGIEIGEVAQATTRARKMCGIGCMKKALRRAVQEDLQEFETRMVVEKEAEEDCRQRIRERSPPMKLSRGMESQESQQLTLTLPSGVR